MPDTTPRSTPRRARAHSWGLCSLLSLSGGVAVAQDAAPLRIEVLAASGDVQRTVRLPKRVSYPMEWSQVRYRGDADGALPHDEWYFVACDERDVYVEGGRSGPMVRVSRCRETRFGFTFVTLASAGSPSNGRRATFCLDHTGLVSVYYGFYGVTEEDWRRKSIFATAVHRDALLDLGSVTVRGVCEREDPRELTVKQRQPQGVEVYRVNAAPPPSKGIEGVPKRETPEAEPTPTASETEPEASTSPTASEADASED